MDPIKLEKFRAIKMYRNTRREFLHSFTKFIVTFFLIGLLLSSPLWIPSLKLLLFVTIPCMLELMFGPKCFFILCIIIVMYLSVELKLSTTSSTMDVYEDYMKRNISIQQHRRSSTISKCENVIVSEVHKVYAQEYEMHHEVWSHEELDGDEKKLNELKQRSDDLIARVTKQWRHEATMQLCYG